MGRDEVRKIKKKRRRWARLVRADLKREERASATPLLDALARGHLRINPEFMLSFIAPEGSAEREFYDRQLADGRTEFEALEATAVLKNQRDDDREAAE
jgi:hypothetical protein